MVNLDWSILAVMVLLFVDMVITKINLKLVADKDADSTLKAIFGILAVPSIVVHLYFGYLAVHGYHTENIYELIAGISYYMYYAVSKTSTSK